ncbi:MAG: hypothetical protein ACO1QB_13060 [Verrucomicrobiales bacterium]
MKITLKDLGIDRKREEGKLGWIALWLMGVPASVLAVMFVLRGCT